MHLLPQEKTQEIIDILRVHINSGTKLDQFTYVRLKHEISKLPSEVASVTCLGLLYGANHEHQKAIDVLQDALNSYNDTFLATNYLAYLARSAQNYLHITESLRLADFYSTDRNFQLLALGSAYMKGDEDRVKVLVERIIRLSSDEQRLALEEVAVWDNNVSEFKKYSGLEECELFALTKVMCDIATKYKQPIVNTHYYIDHSGIDSAYVSEVFRDDPDIISDMNIELAMALADNGILDNKKSTAWFRTISKDVMEIVS